MRKLKACFCLLAFVLLFSCSGSYKEVPEEKFIGTWEVKGRSMFEGIQIKIEKEDGKLVGRIFKLNQNKYVKMLADSNDVWVSEIARNSNYQFRLSEKKIGKDLFALYGVSTTQEFKAEFVNDTIVGLAADNANPLISTITYKKVY